MKQVIITFTLITLCIPFFLGSMDIPLEPIYKKESKKEKDTTPISLEDLITTIDNEINKKYASNGLITLLFTGPCLTKDDMLNIFDFITQHENIPLSQSKLLQKLYDKNNLVRASVNYFITLAKKNFSEVTQNTLQIVENPKLQQKTIPLNKIPARLKTCIINSALSQIEHSYNIDLSGHPSPITCFDICATADLAAVGCENNTIYLWDLKTVTCPLMIKALQQINQVCFNSSGSKIIALLDHKTIKIWDCSQEIPTPIIIENKHWIENIACAHNKKHSTKTIFHAIANEQDYHHLKIITFTIKNHRIKRTTATLYAKASNTSLTYYESISTKYPYSASNDLTTPLFQKLTTLSIKKQDCSPLYLCEQVIKNTQGEILFEKIKESLSYQKLTEHEKEMVKTKITAKNTALLPSTQSLTTSTSQQNPHKTSMLALRSARTLGW